MKNAAADLKSFIVTQIKGYIAKPLQRKPNQSKEEFPTNIIFIYEYIIFIRLISSICSTYLVLSDTCLIPDYGYNLHSSVAFVIIPELDGAHARFIQLSYSKIYFQPKNMLAKCNALYR